MKILKNLHPVVMSIAGSDSGAGAGIQADIKTCAALGVYCTSVLTAITCQNTCRVTAVQAVQKELVGSQFDALVEDFHIAAIKIGMIGSAENLELLVNRLSGYKLNNPHVYIILDTPLRASVGVDLLKRSDQTLLWELIRIADLVTPNLDEAATLLALAKATSKSDMASQVRGFNELGANAVLLKGGHLASFDAADCFLSAEQKITWFSEPRIVAHNSHGTGCTLASAIAAYTVLGYPPAESISRAKKFLTTVLEKSQHINYGLGVGPLVCMSM